MRIAAIVLGVLGGFFELLATNPGSVTTTTDLAAISCWVTFGTGFVAMAGGVACALRPIVGAGLMGLALIAGGLAAAGTIPAIQDMLIIPYILGAILVLIGAVFAVIASRKPKARISVA